MPLDHARYLKGFQHRYKTLLQHPFLCVVKEKHGDRYFHCVTIEALQAVALKLVTERHQENYYQAGPASEELGLTKEQIDALPDGMIKGFAIQEYDRRLRYDRALQEERKVERIAAKAITDHNGALALWILEQRERHEYEGFTLESYEAITNV